MVLLIITIEDLREKNIHKFKMRIEDLVFPQDFITMALPDKYSGIA